MKVAGFGVSLDGFGAGTDQSLEHPLGLRGEEMFQWFFPTRTFSEMIGKEDGDGGGDGECGGCCGSVRSGPGCWQWW